MKQLILFATLFIMVSIYSQDIKSHQWKNRVLLIFSKDKNDKLLQKQIQILKKAKSGLKERKLKLYQFAENQFKTDFDILWLPSTLNIKKYSSKVEAFQVVLIGLDGGIKLKETSILTSGKLFTLIDGMPMRKREMSNKNE